MTPTAALLEAPLDSPVLEVVERYDGKTVRDPASLRA